MKTLEVHLPSLSLKNIIPDHVPFEEYRYFGLFRCPDPWPLKFLVAFLSIMAILAVSIDFRRLLPSAQVFFKESKKMPFVFHFIPCYFLNDNFLSNVSLSSF